MDLVAEEDREAILEDRKRLIEESCLSCGVENFQCFGTSIWDETLYKAWSEIVTNLIPNIRLLETHLGKFCQICDADEVVLFERATFLVISHAQGNSDDPNSSDPRAGTGTTTELSQASSYQDHGGGGDGGDINTLDGTGSEIRSASVDAASAAATNSSRNNNRPPSEIPVAAAGNGTATDVDSSRGQLAGAMSEVTPRHVSRCLFFDDHRFEKISNIIKQFKLSCGKAQSQFQGMQVQNSRFTAYIDQFTANTFILVIVSNPMVKSAATTLNIQNARDHFERFIPRI
jgi:Ras-related GTP-binding protein A/B